ncbi:AAA family ATPase [Candidatus Dependentiae bacterium]|nr:AAA family ATPase [Candidatus Dependentiae bacterium]
MFDFKKYSLTFIILFSFNFLFGEEDLTSATKINELYINQIVQLDRVREILQTIGYQGPRFNKFSEEQKKQLRNWIIEYQKIISEYDRNLSEDVTENKIIEISQIIKNLILNIEIAFATDYKKLTDSSALVKRNRILDEDLNTTQQRIIDNRQNLLKLSNKADNIGITPLNKSFRELERLNQEYNILTKLKWSMVIGAAGLIGLHYISEERLSNLPPLKTFKTFMDRPFNCIEDWLNIMKDMKKNTLLGMFVGAVLKGESSNPVSRSIASTFSEAKKFTEKKSSQAYNYLHGGSSLLSMQDEEKQITLDDPCLVGLDSQKEELYDIVHYFENHTVYDRTKTEVNKGILLIGDSGCGKTLTAKALCGSINQMYKNKGVQSRVHFKEVKHSEVNWAENGFKKLIEEEQQKGPAILIIDEIHLSGLQVEHWNGGTLHSFLTATSGLSSNNDNGKNPIILIGATNRPDLIDPALRRPGRFGTIIRFEKPNFEIRKQYFQVKFNEYAINAENISLDELAKHTQNCSYAQLEKIVSNARFKARTSAKGVSNTKDLLDIIDKHVRRINNECPLNESEKNIVSSHIAGQVITRVILDPKTKILEATIRGILPKINEHSKFSEAAKYNVARGEKVKYGKIFKNTPSEFIDNTDIDDNLKECKIYLAGHIAQKLILGKSYEFKKSDKRKAFLLTQDIVNNGLKTQDLTKEAARINEQKATEMLQQFEKEIETLLSENLSKLTKIHEKLKTELTLSEAQILEIMKQ